MNAQDKLDALILDVAAIKAAVTAIRESLSARPAVAPQGAVADADDLDSEWGDPQVKKDPPRWKGDSFAGCNYSECPAEYLDVLAGLLDWQAGKDDEQGKTWTNKKGDAVPTSTFKRKDALRARGWAARIRAGEVKQPEPPTSDESSAELDDLGELPF